MSRVFVCFYLYVTCIGTQQRLLKRSGVKRILIFAGVIPCIHKLQLGYSILYKIRGTIISKFRDNLSIFCFENIAILKLIDLLSFQFDRHSPKFLIEVCHRQPFGQVIIAQFIGITANQKTIPKLSLKTQVKLNFHAQAIIVGYFIRNVVF